MIISQGWSVISFGDKYSISFAHNSENQKVIKRNVELLRKIIGIHKKINVKKSDKKSVLNIDLWRELLSLMDIHCVNFVWVKGHAGNEYNEICYALAVEAYTNSAVLEDKGYIS